MVQIDNRIAGGVHRTRPGLCIDTSFNGAGDKPAKCFRERRFKDRYAGRWNLFHGFLMVR